MHTVMDFLKLAAGLLITVSLIATGFYLFNRARQVGIGIIEDKEREAYNASIAHITKYDGDVIKGGTVISYIGSIQDDVTTIYIKTPKNTSGFYIMQNGQLKVNLSDLKDYDSASYVAPLSKYKVNVTMDANGVPERVDITYKP